MTILHLSAVKGWGGGENHIEDLCLELKKTDSEVNSIILCVENGLFHKRLEQTDLRFEISPLAYNLDFRYVFRIIYLSKKNKIDLIHIHDPSAIALAILADKFYNLPPFIFGKKTSFPIKKKRLTLFKYNYSKIKKYICVSNETNRVTAEAIIDKSKIVTIYDGTNMSNKSTTTPFLLRNKFNIDKSKKIIGVIGNHIRAKHFETLIEVVNEIVNEQKRTDFFFVQIGTFTDRTENLLKMVKDSALENHICFLGFTPNASNFIPQFDALLITSQSEGLPLVIYESFYHCKPVISTNVGGIPEIIEDGVNGFLAAKYDYKTLSEKIFYLFDNEELIAKFTTLSNEKLHTNYTSAIMAKKTVEIYKSVIDGN
jgi:glycosyltransferase involved in cell wall biosynthesis